MQTEAAVLWEIGADWKVETVELDDPGPGEVLLRHVASGICHSDEHFVTGDLIMTLPMVGGHEGGGIIEAVGPGVTSVAPGDHVITATAPVCGRCRMCVTGHSNLCDSNAFTLSDAEDDSSRHHLGGKNLGLFCNLGSFARHTVVSERSVVKIDPYADLEKICLLSCGATTGWGSAVNRAAVKAGDQVAVIGVGGVGSSAVQGARLAGAGRIFAIDPVAFKREQALTFGATHTAESIQAARPLIDELTWGQMCDKVICTMGVGRGELMADIMALAGKRGRVVLTNVHLPTETQITISALELQSYEKELVGCLWGSANPGTDLPMLVSLYRSGKFDLDGMVTRTYSLHDINKGFEDMRNGLNIRGVIVYE